MIYNFIGLHPTWGCFDICPDHSIKRADYIFQKGSYLYSHLGRYVLGIGKKENILDKARLGLVWFG